VLEGLGLAVTTFSAPVKVNTDMVSALIKQFNGKPVGESHDAVRPNTSRSNDCVHRPISADPKCWLHGRPNAMCISCLSVIFHILLANINITIICDTTLLS